MNIPLELAISNFQMYSREIVLSRFDKTFNTGFLEHCLSQVFQTLLGLTLLGVHRFVVGLMAVALFKGHRCVCFALEWELSEHSFSSCFVVGWFVVVVCGVFFLGGGGLQTLFCTNCHGSWMCVTAYWNVFGSDRCTCTDLTVWVQTSVRCLCSTLHTFIYFFCFFSVVYLWTWCLLYVL